MLALVTCSYSIQCCKHLPHSLIVSFLLCSKSSAIDTIVDIPTSMLLKCVCIIIPSQQHTHGSKANCGKVKETANGLSTLVTYWYIHSLSSSIASLK